MKKVIEKLEEARLDLVRFSRDDSKVGLAMSALSNIENVLYELETPRWETPEQYKKRTGKACPDNGAVYTICVKNHREFWYPKSLELVKKVGVPLKNVVIATEAGPPPDDWRPE